MKSPLTPPAIAQLIVVLTCLLLFKGESSYAQGTSAFSFHDNPLAGTHYIASVNGACVGCTVQNPARAANQNTTDFATITIPLGFPAGARANLRLRLNSVAPSGAVAGVVIGNGRLIDLITVNSLQVRTYLGNTLQEMATGVNALELKAVGANRYVVEFITTKPFSWVELQVSGVNDALNLLDVYYAYGTPLGATPLGAGRYSRFNSPQSGTDYAASVSGLCLLCGVSNPARAADQNLTAGNYATIQTTAGVAASTQLRLRLESPAPAGSVAGLVISTGSLLDVNVLNSLTIRTYGRDAQGNLVLRETATAANLLTANLLTGNRYALGFTTTQPFEYVEISVGALASVLNTVNVYYAFAVPGPSTPLPVELTSFNAQALPGGTVRLLWHTASERNNAGFVVERGAAASALVAIGEVAGQGSTSTPRDYEFLDSQPAGSANLMYYRLRQRDFDGAEHLSAVVAVRRAQATGGALAAYPNPAHDQLTIRTIAAATDDASFFALTLTDALGRTVRRHTLTADGIVTVSVVGLPPGIYTARIGNQATAVVVSE